MPNANDTSDSQPDVSPVSYEEIAPYIAPITYRQLIVDQCGIDDAGVKTKFMQDLILLEASADIIAQIEAEMQRIEIETGDNEDEYVCTPEMFEQSQLSADEALQAVNNLRGEFP